MKLSEAYEAYKKFKVPSLSEIRDNASEHSKTSLVIIIFLVMLLLLALQYIPHLQVAQFNITNQKDLADAENSYRATLAQIFGGVAIGIGLYYTWRRIGIAEKELKATQDNLEITQKNLAVAQENLKVSQESQITERFTRAIEQLGSEKIEIRLGGIYALERIAKESEKDYWSIVNIFAAYIREKSSINEKLNEDKKISTDVQAILEVLFKHEHPDTGIINLQDASLIEAQIGSCHLKWVNFERANLKKANISWADLECANLNGTNLEKSYLSYSNLKYSNLIGANLEKAILSNADLTSARLVMANLKWANLEGANLKEVTFKEADLTKTNLEGADLRGAYYLSPSQLSKSKSLYNAKIDEELLIILKDEHPELFESNCTEGELKRRSEILANLGFVPSKD